MKKIIATFAFLLASSSTVFAAQADQNCITSVKAHSHAIKTDARQILQSVKSEYNSQMKKYGEATIGMGMRGEAEGATLILQGTRKVIGGKTLSAEESDALATLCQFNLDVDQAVSN